MRGAIRRLLLVLFVAVLGVTAMLAQPSRAHASTTAQTRVGVSGLAAATHVTSFAAVVVDTQRGNRAAYDEHAQGDLFATDATELSGTALARSLGQEGEAQIAGAGNTTRIALANGGYRIPDILDESGGVLGEVKNVGRLSYTQQLRDFAAYADANGLQFDLYVRGSTRLSGPLQDAVDSGSINLWRWLAG